MAGPATMLRCNADHRDIRVRACGRVNGRAQVSGGGMADWGVK